MSETYPIVADELKDLPHINIRDLEPFQGDLKQLTRREYEKLKRSILENGIIVPFFVWEETGKILDGHQRQRVMINEGWTMTVPVIYISAENIQDAKKKLLVISSQYGRITQEGWDEFTWDLDEDWLEDTTHFDALTLVFGEWEDDEKEKLTLDKTDADIADSRAGELAGIWGTETGQIWRLPSRHDGYEHRLICGSAADMSVVERLMDGESARLMVTDPPYGVNYADLIKSRPNQKRGGWADIENDELTHKELEDLLRKSLHGAGALTAFVWHPSLRKRAAFWDALEENGWRLAQEIIWVKDRFVFGRADYQWQHECCIYAVKPGGAGQPDRTQTTVWEIKKTHKADHPTSKPLEIYEKPIELHTEPGEIVYEPFCGSGSGIVAAENLGRQCRAIELAPPYVALILQRYLEAFDIEPELIG